MVPEGWEQVQLGDIANFINGRGFKPHEWGKEGLPIIRIQNLNGSEEFNYYSGDYNPKILVETGSLLFAWSGSRGTSFGPHIWKQRDGLLNYHTWLVKFDEQSIDKYFFYYNLLGITTKIESEAHGAAALVHTQKNRIVKFRTLLPPLPEQKKIARILSTWDKAIETVDKLIENSKQQKKALMQQLLTGKKRLPGFSGEWKEVRLGKVATINPKKSAKPEDGLVSFLPMEAVSETAQLLSLETKKYEEVSKGFSAFSDGDVLVAKITPCFENGKGAYVTNLTNGIGFGSTEFHVIRTEQELFSRFIYYITNSYEFRFRGEANMQGSAGQRRVPTDFLRAYPIALPPIDEQKAICSILDAVSLTIDKLSNKKEVLTHAKQALMQQLLTGKRRVTTSEQDFSKEV